MAALDVLIPTFGRPAALAVTLTCLAGQSHPPMRVVVSDQSERAPVEAQGEVQAVRRLLAFRGHESEVHRHVPRRGLAENRSFLLSQVRAPRVLFLDDDLLLEPDLVGRLSSALDEERCGFVGSAVIGLSYLHDIRPHEQAIEFWAGRVVPETVLPGSPAWERYRLHNAANLHHVAQRLRIRPDHGRKYKVAWVGGCVMYETEALRAVGGFDFWPQIPPEHAGEDVLVQLRVMARFGGCGLIPSGAYHQELPTTVTDRRFDAPRRLPILEGPGFRPDILD